jgi:hypothetical protein
LFPSNFFFNFLIFEWNPSCVLFAQPYVPEPLQQYQQHQLQKQKSMQSADAGAGKGGKGASAADVFEIDPRSSVLKAISALRYASDAVNHWSHQYTDVKIDIIVHF